MELYHDVEICDFILPMLPDSGENKEFYKQTTFGAKQLSLGFCRPLILQDFWGKYHGFSPENAVFYGISKENGLLDEISHVLEWDIFRYHAMQSELQTLATKYYTESLENLRQVVFSMEGEKSET